MSIDPSIKSWLTGFYQADKSYVKNSVQSLSTKEGKALSKLLKMAQGQDVKNPPNQITIDKLKKKITHLDNPSKRSGLNKLRAIWGNWFHNRIKSSQLVKEIQNYLPKEVSKKLSSSSSESTPFSSREDYIESLKKEIESENKPLAKLNLSIDDLNNLIPRLKYLNLRDLKIEGIEEKDLLKWVFSRGVQVESLVLNVSEALEIPFDLLPNPLAIKVLDLEKHPRKCSLTNEQCQLLLCFPNLKKLNIAANHELKGAYPLQIISQLQHLEELNLSTLNQITCLDQLKSLTHLRYLNIDLTEFGDEDLKVLSILKNLENLSGAFLQKLTSRGLAEVGRCLSLKILNLAWSTIADKHFEQLRGLTSLNILNLGYNHNISGEFFLALKHLPIKSLSLAGCENFKETSFEYLKSFKLELLCLPENFETHDTFKAFQDEMQIPNIQFMSFGF